MNSSNSEVPRRGILWFATIAMALFTGFMCLFFSQAGWTRFSVGFEVISGAVAIALLLTLINKDRYWWAMRVITFIIFALYFWYVIDECYIKQKPLQLGGLGDASPLNAVRGFLFFGVPCLLYTLWGSPWGKLGQSKPGNITKADVATFQMARASRWLFLLLTLLVVVGACIRN
jgi:hypothetical protein